MTCPLILFSHVFQNLQLDEANPKKWIYGTNFVGGEKIIRDELRKIDQTRVNFTLTQRGITWKFIAARSPHWGGVWERLVQSTKRFSTPFSEVKLLPMSFFRQLYALWKTSWMIDPLRESLRTLMMSFLWHQTCCYRQEDVKVCHLVSSKNVIYTVDVIGDRRISSLTASGGAG